MAFQDGATPFLDPYESLGLLNPGELGVEEARMIGAVTRDIELALASGGIATAAARGGATLGVGAMRFQVALHGADHSFGSAGRLRHIQLMMWRACVKGTHTIWRIPLPWR